jgi:hypothetical protein
MNTGFVSLQELVSGMPAKDKDFLSDVIRRDQNPDGTDKGIVRRMKNEICKTCHSQYKEKYPSKPFKIKCQGIYDTPDYEGMQAKQKAEAQPGDPIDTIDQIREIYDPAFWSSRNMVVKNEAGDIVPFTPRWYQEHALRCTAPRKVDRWGRGMGKALSIDTPIPSPSGWTTMEAILPGDVIFDERGLPTSVTFVTDVMDNHKCYDVVFSDGSVITADAEHLWETWTHSARKAESRKERRSGKLSHIRPVPKPSVVTTEEIKTTLFHGNGKRTEHNHSVKVALALQYSDKDLPIHPYVLGVWLGDGTSSCGQLTCADPEIITELRSLGIEVVPKTEKYQYSLDARPIKKDDRGRITTNDSLRGRLLKLGVLNNKHVPDIYLRGSVHQRLALLQGLMDTDGTIQKSGACTFDNTNKALSDAVEELTVSLGIKAGRSEKPAVLYGKYCGIDYRVNFTPTIPVFRLPRKLARQKLHQSRKTQSHRYIVEIRERPSVPVKCITVDSPKHLYLAGRSCIPTHNTIVGVAAELHYACINKNTELIIVCPAQAQGQLWYDEILFQSDNSPQLKGMVMQKKQQPFYYIRLGNGAKIKVFTAGSKAGRGADAIRGQNPRRIRADEQDYLADKDYKAIMPLLRRFKNSTFHGSSTPTGLRGMYWKMCRQFLEYKEFYFPITEHPDWNTEQLNEEVCMQEAKTMDRYRHEFLAEFGDPAAGVFKAKFVDAAQKPYTYKTCVYNPKLRYFMGVDWNGKGTGTRIRIVEYDPETRTRRVVKAVTIADLEWTVSKSIAMIVQLNQEWHCTEVGIDAGFGFAQDELIRVQGQNAAPSEVDKKRLKFVKVIDFGAKLETNKLVPNRDPDSKYLPEDDDQLKRATKPFMVEGCVMAFEGELVQFSAEDKLLEEQLRGYRVKNWTKSDVANSYETDSESGDHDLDAFMIAMLLIELKYGLWHTPETMKRLAQIAHVSGWGIAGSPTVAAPSSTAQKILAKQESNHIPSRVTGQGPKLGPSQDELRILHHMKGGMYVAPKNPGTAPGSRVPSRTGIFQNQTPRNTFAGSRFSRF